MKFLPKSLARLLCLFALAPLSGLAAVEDSIAQRVVACAACHGEQGRASREGYFPRIAGKPETYLYNQLVNFREGRRQYPLMVYLLDGLSDDYLHEIAAYFATQHPPVPAPETIAVTAAVLQRGEQLAKSGDPSKQLPACSACHGKALNGVEPAIPGLLGLPREYLSAQLGSWQNGVRRARAPDCMAQLVERMDGNDIAAVSAWLAVQPVDATARPQPATAERLPVDCGSVRP